MRWFGFARWVRARRSRLLLERLDRAITQEAGHRLCDGDTVPFPGYPRWAELLTRELPELAPPTVDGPLIRPYVVQPSADQPDAVG